MKSLLFFLSNLIIKPIIIMVITAIALSPFAYLLNQLAHHQCKNNVEEMGREYRYDFINGCRVGQEDGTFIYWEMYRVND